MSESILKEHGPYFSAFRDEFIRLYKLTDMDVAVPDITMREGKDNETNTGLVVLALPPQDEGAIKMARHLFGHWIMDLDADGDEIADEIGNAYARIGEPAVATPDLDSREFLQALVSHAEKKRQGVPNPRWKRAYEAVEMSASTLDAFIARSSLPLNESGGLANAPEAKPHEPKTYGSTECKG